MRGQSVELETEIKVQVWHPAGDLESPPPLSISCVIAQGAHSVRTEAEGHTCTFAGGELVRSGIAVGPATIRAIATVSGVAAPPASVDVTMEHAGNFGFYLGGGQNQVFDCNSIRSVTVSGTSVSFNFTLLDPTAPWSRPGVIPVGRVSVFVKPDGTFGELVHLPADPLRVVDMAKIPVGDDALSSPLNTSLSSDDIARMKAFFVAKVIDVHGKLHGQDLDLRIEIPSGGSSDSRCSTVYHPAGWVSNVGFGGSGGSASAHHRPAGSACTRDTECERFCKNNVCD